jgi:hypothetical protein
MNNIHILPTEKPSRLYQTRTNPLILDSKFENGKTNRHIYITSDEEIKDGDWFINELGQLWQHNGIVKPYKGSKKIILTTDQDLINDNIQSIPDEFLEWFVKNPSCDFVEFNAYPISPNGNIVGTDKLYPFDGLISNFRIDYKIIIPQEEPKQEEDEIIDISDHDGIGNAVDNLNNEPPQETLEEAAKLYIGVPITRIIDDEERYYTSNIGEYDAFIEGAKWQAERMYSEEDMIKFHKWAYLKNRVEESGKTTKELLSEWFKQFKKK